MPKVSPKQKTKNQKVKSKSSQPNLVDYIIKLAKRSGSSDTGKKSKASKVEQGIDVKEIKSKNQQEETEKYIRPSWDNYFIEVSRIVASRATCDRGRSGCVIVKDKQILTTGYVGSPKGLPHCDEAGHYFKKTLHDNGEITNHCVRTIHAEQNAICQAAKLGIPLEGATLYCKMEPCAVCAKMIINCGIERVVCEKHYHGGADTAEMMKKAKVKLEVLKDEMQTYKDM